MMPKNKHGVKPCLLTKCGAARAPENAPVCNMGGLTLVSPVGEVSKVRKLNVLTIRNDYGQKHFSLFIFHFSFGITANPRPE